MTIPRGRPRASGATTTGLGTAEDILRAAATLFCTVGYGSTSTHAIAREAGLRQSSIYHYFSSKQEILLALLLQTVKPSIEIANALLERPEPAAARLWALCVLDVQLLAAGPVNLGSLYLLPELNDPKLAEFHERREELRQAYRTLISECDGVRPVEVSRTADMVLALVESLILRRREHASLTTSTVIDSTSLDLIDLAPRIADAALRIVALPPEAVLTAHQQAATLVEPFSTLD
jgi:AcrR family transcriptional regulator